MPISMFGPQTQGYQVNPQPVSPVDVAKAGVLGQQIQGQNAIRQAFQDPDAVDATGMVNPNVMRQIFAADPNVGMGLIQHQQQMQTHQAQMANYNAMTALHKVQTDKAQSDVRERAFEAAEPIFDAQDQTYKKIMKETGDPSKAQEAAVKTGLELYDAKNSMGMFGGYSDKTREGILGFDPIKTPFMTKTFKEDIARRKAQEAAPKLYNIPEGDENVYFLRDPTDGTLKEVSRAKRFSRQVPDVSAGDKPPTHFQTDPDTGETTAYVPKSKQIESVPLAPGVKPKSYDPRRDIAVQKGFESSLRSRFPEGTPPDFDYFGEMDRYYEGLNRKAPKSPETEQETIKRVLKGKKMPYEPDKYDYWIDGNEIKRELRPKG